jgi:hypothetical protein
MERFRLWRVFKQQEERNVIDNQDACERSSCGRAGQAMAIVALLAVMALGCGGGGNSSIAPFAGVWVANSGVPNVPHFSGAAISGLSGVVNGGPAQTLINAGFVSPQDTLFGPDSGIWVVDGGNGSGCGGLSFQRCPAYAVELDAQPGADVHNRAGCGEPAVFRISPIRSV